MNKKGMVVGVVIGIWLVGTALMFLASHRHRQQRLEKQQTEEGKIEYPLKQNYPDHSYKLGQ